MNNYPPPNRTTDIHSGKPCNIKIVTLNYLTLLTPAITFHIAVFWDVTLQSTDHIALIHAVYLGLFYLWSDPFTQYYSNRQVPTFPSNISPPTSWLSPIKCFRTRRCQPHYDVWELPTLTCTNRAQIHCQGSNAHAIIELESSFPLWHIYHFFPYVF